MKTLKIISAAIIAAGLFGQQFARAQQTTTEPVKLSIDKSAYGTAIGLRGGETSGLTIKHFLNERSALEGILGVWPYGFSITGLYERHENAFNVEGMKWYYGGGGHMALRSGRTYYVYSERNGYWYKYRSGSGTGVGVDGILGLEYKIKPIPFAISLDIKPLIEVTADGMLYEAIDPGFGIKVTF